MIVESPAYSFEGVRHSVFVVGVVAHAHAELYILNGFHTSTLKNPRAQRSKPNIHALRTRGSTPALDRRLHCYGCLVTTAVAAVAMC